MEAELHLRIVLEKPPAGIDFGLQEGKGHEYKTIQTQRSKGRDLTFDCTVMARDNREDGLPNFLGPLTQGPPTDRFIYFDIGQFAGQKDCCWTRRLKIPLAGITWEMIRQVSADPRLLLEVCIPGTGKDGGPNCGKVMDSRRLMQRGDEASNQFLSTARVHEGRGPQATLSFRAACHSSRIYSRK